MRQIDHECITPFSEILLLYEWTILLGGTTVHLESHHHFESDRVYSVDLANGGLIGRYCSFSLSIFYLLNIANWDRTQVFPTYEVFSRIH